MARLLGAPEPQLAAPGEDLGDRHARPLLDARRPTSTNGRPRRVATRRPTEVLPAPMYPVSSEPARHAQRAISAR